MEGEAWLRGDAAALSGGRSHLAAACVLRSQDATMEFINRVRNCEDRERGKRY